MSTPPVDPSVARGGDAPPSPGAGRVADEAVRAAVEHRVAEGLGVTGVGNRLVVGGP